MCTKLTMHKRAPVVNFHHGGCVSVREAAEPLGNGQATIRKIPYATAAAHAAKQA